MIVIGDEVLSGRTRDANMHHLAKTLDRHGIALVEARFVRDDPRAIAEAVNALRARHDHVFTSGGIGPTHDDVTADAVAAAFGVPIGVREDARKLLAAHYARRGMEFNEARQRMARIPDGAALIPNPVSVAPGFSLGNVHVMAGVPSVFRAMLDEVLNRIAGGPPTTSRALRVARPEGEVAGPVARLAARHPEVAIGSYPFDGPGGTGTTLVARGMDPAAVERALAELRETFPDGELL